MNEISFVEHHLHESLRAALAEAYGDELLARRLHAEAKARLLSMSDEEIWTLAKLSSNNKDTAKSAYAKYKEEKEKLRTNVAEWVTDIVRPTVQ